MTSIATAYAVEDPPESSWDPDDCFIVCEDVRVDEPDPEVCPPSNGFGLAPPIVSPLLTAATAPAHLQYARPLPPQAMGGFHATAQAIPAALPAARQMPTAQAFYNPWLQQPYQQPGGYMPSLPQQPYPAGAPPPVAPFHRGPMLSGTAGQPVGYHPTAGQPVGYHPAALDPGPFPRDGGAWLATAAMVQQQQAQAAARAAQMDAARLGASAAARGSAVVAAAAVVQAAAGMQHAQAAAAAGIQQAVVATTAATVAVKRPKPKAGKTEAAAAAAAAPAAGLGVCWVEVKGKPGWWPAQIMAASPQVAAPPPAYSPAPAPAPVCGIHPLRGLTLSPWTHLPARLCVQAKLAEGCLRVRLFGTAEEREVQAESESMSFDEPGVGANLQQLQLKDFRSKAAHNKFKAAVAEARGSLGLGPLELDPAEVEADAAAEAEAAAKKAAKAEAKAKAKAEAEAEAEAAAAAKAAVEAKASLAEAKRAAAAAAAEAAAAEASVSAGIVVPTADMEVRVRVGVRANLIPKPKPKLKPKPKPKPSPGSG